MAFRITARTLLELGAELISSDAVAVHELIKNAIDARASLIRITIQVVLSHSRHLQVLEAIDEERLPIESLRRDVESWLAPDAPAAAKRQFLAALDGATDLTTFRDLYLGASDEANFIEIWDNGEGMSLESLDEIFLTIGTRSRRREKDEWGDHEPDRVLLGDKGLGRLSVMRLGDRVSITTSKAGDRYWNELHVDWRIFSHDSDALLHEVPVAPERGDRKPDAKLAGTTIRATHLKSDWDREKFVTLISSDFARMIDPFDRRRANRLFRIIYNGEQATLPQIATRLFEEAHAVVKCRFFYDAEGHARLVGETDYRLHTAKQTTFEYSEEELISLTRAKSTQVIRSLGPFTVEFLWFNRLYLTAVEGLGTKRDVQDVVRQWAGGLMVFRDGVRINPYGGPDDDWLHLDKKAFGRSGYKLNRQQLVGRVNLTWRNKLLVEQTNREGLVQNDHMLAFVAILQSVLERFKTFSETIEEALKREELTSLDLLKQRVVTAKTDVQKRLREIAVNAPAQARPLREVERIVDQLAEQIDGVDEIIADYKDERRKFVHLAGLGLMVELILHELARATGNTLGTLEGIDPSELQGRLPAVFANLESQLKTLQKRIQTLDPLSTARRQVKERFSVREVVEQVVEAREAEAQRHDIAVRVEQDGEKDWRIRAVKGMLIQVIENLLSNAMYWLKQRAVAERGFKPRIVIRLDPDNQTISVTDNGPGVLPSRAEEIFQPFVTSKPPGKGSGLGLYIARELCEYHKWSIALVGKPGREKSLHTFVIDLAGGTK